MDELEPHPASQPEANDVPNPDREPTEDGVLLTQVRQGSHLAFRKLYEKYAPPLLRKLRTTEQGTIGPDDCCHEAFLRLFYQPPEHAHHLDRWLFRVARNHAIDAARRAQQHTRAVRDVLSDPSSHTADSDEARARRYRLETLLSFVQKLPERERRVLTLRYLPVERELTLAEVAQRANLPADVVRGILQRAKEKLRLLCHDYELLLPVALVVAGASLTALPANAKDAPLRWSSEGGGVVMTLILAFAGMGYFCRGLVCRHVPSASEHTVSGRGSHSSEPTRAHPRGPARPLVFSAPPPPRVPSPSAEATTNASSADTIRPQPLRANSPPVPRSPAEERSEEQWRRLCSIPLRLNGGGRVMHLSTSDCESESSLRIQPGPGGRFSIRGTLIPVDVRITAVNPEQESLLRSQSTPDRRYSIAYLCDGTRHGAELVMSCANEVYELVDRDQLSDSGERRSGATYSQASLALSGGLRHQDAERMIGVFRARFNVPELIVGKVMSGGLILANSWAIGREPSQNGAINRAHGAFLSALSLSDFSRNGACSIVPESVVPMETADVIARVCDADPQFQLCQQIRPIHVARPSCFGDGQQGITLDILGSDPWSGYLQVRTPGGPDLTCDQHRCTFPVPMSRSPTFGAEGRGLLLFEPFVAHRANQNESASFYHVIRHLFWQCRGVRDQLAIQSIDGFDPDELSRILSRQ